MKETNEQQQLRKYVLGKIGEGDELSAVEERIMTDDDYFQKLTMVEEDLIQDYVDENLDPADRANFEKCFLISAENRQKVKFARALRKYVDETKDAPEAKKKTSFFDSLKAFFSTPVPATLGVLIILGFAGFFIWKSFSASTDSEVLIALNKAYKTDRPTEARITGFDYAPKIEGTRGKNKNEDLNLVFAKSRATEAVLKNETAENLHELGLVYLAEQNFDEAIKQFEKAVKLAPNDAKLRNDLGVALMGKAEISDDGKLANLGKALKEFENAIKLNQALGEALFNKALCLELIPMPNQAKTAWNEYLKIDSTSAWANEARQHLEKLDTGSNKDLSDNEFEQEFFELYQKKNDEDMWRFISRNRELIKLKYLPQRLAMKFVESPAEDRRNTLNALRYLGNLEQERIGDYFASDLADFYEKLPEEKIELLREGQSSIKKGYKFCLNGKFSSALDEFSKAKELFIKAGNFLEASAISQHFIAYCLYNTDRKREAIEEFNEVKKFCERQKYRWLNLACVYWLTGWSSHFADFHSSEKAKAEYLAGLKISEEIGDLYYTQKYLQTLAKRNYKLRQEKEMLFYLQKLFIVSNEPKVSLRQKFRNYSTSLPLLVSAKLESAAEEVASEELILANTSGESSYIATAQIDSGMLQMQTGNFSEAEKWFSEAEQTAKNIDEETQKNDLLADIFLKTGNLAFKKNDYQEAVKYYDESLEIVETQKAPTLLYELSKLRLSAYQELGNDAEVEKQIPSVIKIAEDYRAEILEENERNSFFDNEQSIYDIAVEHEFNVGNNNKAFDYAEISNSRSLLDWLNKGINKSDEKSEILLKESTDPYTLDEIQNRMPSEVQILQYTVLEKKVLIWIITKNNIVVVPSEIASRQLNEETEKYLTLIQSSDADSQSQAKMIGRRLYDFLITPALPFLDQNKKICLIPNKSLFQLPFAALVSPGDNFFLTEFSLFYAPSASVFILCTENALKKQKTAGESLLSIGNPSFDRQKFKDLQDLPVSETEANEISRYYQNPKLLPGKQATKKSVQNLLQKAEIIHFAGHYIVHHSLPLSSGLVLAKDDAGDGVLTNYELAGNNLQNTKLVVLSACQTGVEGYYDGEGLVGMSRTFLASGVPLVIASQWKVDSDAAAKLMKDFHRYRRQENLSTNNALRQAQIDMLKNEKDGYSSPYYWAAFASFGGYANF